jgi:hypothetical protein
LGVFKLDFVKISLTEQGKVKFNHPCNPDDDVEFPEDSDYELVEKNFWVIRIGNINGLSIDYSRGNLPFVAYCRVHHTPMRWNFWHFSLRWANENGELLRQQFEERELQKIAKRIGTEARAIIKKFASIYPPEYPTLEESCFKKQIG